MAGCAAATQECANAATLPPDHHFQDSHLSAEVGLAGRAQPLQLPHGGHVKRGLAGLQPRQVVLEAGQRLHKLHLLPLPRAQRLLDAQQLRPNRCRLLQRQASSSLGELGVDIVQRLHPPLLVVHLNVDVRKLPTQPLHPRLRVGHVRLQEVRVVLRR